MPLVVTHPDCAAHEPFPGHPERSSRLQAALAGARDAGATQLLAAVEEPAVLAAVSRVHDPRLAVRLRAACQHAPSIFDCEDNPISPGSYRAAVAAVAVALAAADTVARGGERLVFGAVRPPGHHARRDRAMGFCFFNNVAIAAEALLDKGVGPLAIVDFDVHHGNGTQEHFWTRNDVFYLSVHHYPFYPGSGSADEIGEGRGRGFTRNLPLAGGADDDVYCEALAAGVADVEAAMSPAAWLISAGFDAHGADPLGGMYVTDDGFARLGAILGAAAAGRPVIALLEGGYNLHALQRSVQLFLGGLRGGGDAPGEKTASANDVR